MTYTLIDSVTLGSSASSVTFSSISATGKGDLVLVCDVIGTALAQASFRVNADSGSNYNNVEMSGNGSTTNTGAGSSGTSGFVDYNAVSISNTVRSTLTLQALDYSATDKHKSFLYRGGNAGSSINASALRWASTSAITSLTFYGSFAATSTFNLYQIVSE
jgi:hypothetical protein